ncbi:Zinc finger, C3HC-like [Sesbania bispinosa]|nr:Zinc finger, C3HC-like [Sesbania bispinosa]
MERSRCFVAFNLFTNDLRRLSTFKLAGKMPRVSGSLACAKRASSIEEVSASSEEFSRQLDRGHKNNYPWRGNSCPESLVQFPPTSPSALIGGFKDRCDGLLQFYTLPIVSSSAVK